MLSNLVPDLVGRVCQTDLIKAATAATGGRVRMAGVCIKLWLAVIYFLVHAILLVEFCRVRTPT